MGLFLHIRLGILMLLVSLGASSAPPNQKEALLTLKAGLDPIGTELTTWTTDTEVCYGQGFGGVTCDFYGVTDIELGTYLSYPAWQKNTSRVLIGAAFLEFPRLQLFRANYWNIGGKLPAELGLLPSLKSLSLYSNRLTGVIPDTFGANFSKLSSIDLSSNNLTGPVPLNLTKRFNQSSLGLNLAGNPYLCLIEYAIFSGSKTLTKCSGLQLNMTESPVVLGTPAPNVPILPPPKSSALPPPGPNGTTIAPVPQPASPQSIRTATPPSIIAPVVPPPIPVTEPPPGDLTPPPTTGIPPPGPVIVSDTGNVVKVGIPVAVSTVGAFVSVASALYFGLRFRKKKAAIVKRAITLLFRPPERLMSVTGYTKEENERKMTAFLTEVMTTWDAWHRLGPKLSFPHGTGHGVWKSALAGKEARALCEACVSVDEQGPLGPLLAVIRSDAEIRKFAGYQVQLRVRNLTQAVLDTLPPDFDSNVCI